MRPYECMTILDPSLEEEERRQIVERLTGVITQAAGTVEKVDDWGRRRLAYPINGKEEGYYVLFHFQANHAGTQELERVMKITDGVVRYLLVRKEEPRKKNTARPQDSRDAAARASAQPAGQADGEQQVRAEAPVEAPAEA